jgi:hypothetical protein
MSRIFIGYRRDDSRGDARYLRRLLVERFGKARVYMDIDSIPPGADFVVAVRNALAGAAAALIVIGRRWLSPENRMRLHGATDLVRQEVAQALNANLLVVPVLVDGASIPSANELPHDIRALATRNAFYLREHSFESDVGTLMRELQKLPGLARETGAAKGPRKKAGAGGRSADKPIRSDPGSAPGRKPRARTGPAQEERERASSPPKPRRKRKPNPPAADNPRGPETKPDTRRRGKTPSAQANTGETRRSPGGASTGSSGRKAGGGKKTAEGQRPAPPAGAQPKNRPARAKKAAPAGANGAKPGAPGGQRSPSRPSGSGGGRPPKRGGGATPKQPAKQTSRPRSGNKGRPRG